ncbi:MAG: hypothetical protein ABIP46_14350 [Polaromonas sp.]
MRDPKNRLVVLCKLLLAAIAMVALLALPIRELAPRLSLAELLLYCAGGVVGVFALLVVLAIGSLQFSQFILRKGGTDTQWFWFSGEPRGLKALREGNTLESQRNQS